MSQKCNAEGRLIVESSESIRLVSYRCPKGILTVGWGHTGKDVLEQMVISRAQAEVLLEEDLGVAESAVSRLVHQPLNENQFSALVSFVFNIGQGTFADPKHDMLRYLNAGELARASAEFPLWNKLQVNGVMVPELGLTRRRALERALFEKPVEAVA